MSKNDSICIQTLRLNWNKLAEPLILHPERLESLASGDATRPNYYYRENHEKGRILHDAVNECLKKYDKTLIKNTETGAGLDDYLTVFAVEYKNLSPRSQKWAQNAWWLNKHVILRILRVDKKRDIGFTSTRNKAVVVFNGIDVNKPLFDQEEHTIRSYVESFGINVISIHCNQYQPNQKVIQVIALQIAIWNGSVKEESDDGVLKRLSSLGILFATGQLQAFVTKIVSERRDTEDIEDIRDQETRDSTPSDFKGDDGGQFINSVHGADSERELSTSCNNHVSSKSSSDVSTRSI